MSNPEKEAPNMISPMQGEVLAGTLAPGSATQVNLTAITPPGYEAPTDPFFCRRFMTLHASGGAAVFAFVVVDEGASPTNLAPAFVPPGTFALAATQTGGVLPADVSVDAIVPVKPDGQNVWLLLASSSGCQVRAFASSAKI